jgi:hypothetical protein
VSYFPTYFLSARAHIIKLVDSNSTVLSLSGLLTLLCVHATHKPMIRYVISPRVNGQPQTAGRNELAATE